MQENEEGEMGIPCTNLKMEADTIKDVNDGDFPGTANTMLTHSQNTKDKGCDSFFFFLFIFFTYHTIVLFQVALKKKV